ICDQVEDASAAKGLIKREVTRVVTPGTLTEEDLLDPKRSNHLVAVVPAGNGRAGVAWVELSAGQFLAADLALPALADELGRLAPSECVCPENDLARTSDWLRQAVPGATLSERPDWHFDGQTARAALFRHFNVS